MISIAYLFTDPISLVNPADPNLFIVTVLWLVPLLQSRYIV